MIYERFWLKMSLLVQLRLEKKSGGTFKMFDDAQNCLGVPYQTANNWAKGSIPRKEKVRKAAEALNVAFKNSTTITESTLSDETSEYEFARALGVSDREAQDALLSVSMNSDGKHPLDDFWFSEERAKGMLRLLGGSYEIRNMPGSRSGSAKRRHRALEISGTSSRDGRYCVVASLAVPSITPPSDHEESFKYDGVVCERSGLWYWIFRQTGESLNDYIFMITDRFDVGGRDPVAKGTLITMGQKLLLPIMQRISVNRVDSASQKKRRPAASKA
jgi:hypothetical protein